MFVVFHHQNELNKNIVLQISLAQVANFYIIKGRNISIEIFSVFNIRIRKCLKFYSHSHSGMRQSSIIGRLLHFFLLSSIVMLLRRVSKFPIYVINSLTHKKYLTINYRLLFWRMYLLFRFKAKIYYLETFILSLTCKLSTNECFV